MQVLINHVFVCVCVCISVALENDGRNVSRTNLEPNVSDKCNDEIDATMYRCFQLKRL